MYYGERRSQNLEPSHASQDAHELPVTAAQPSSSLDILRTHSQEQCLQSLEPSGPGESSCKNREALKRDNYKAGALKRLTTLGAEGRSKAIRKGNETKGAEGRSKAIRKGNETKGAEGRSAAARKRNETMGAEGRSAAARKSHETRRANKKRQEELALIRQEFRDILEPIDLLQEQRSQPPEPSGPDVSSFKDYETLIREKRSESMRKRAKNLGPEKLKEIARKSRETRKANQEQKKELARKQQQEQDIYRSLGDIVGDWPTLTRDSSIR